MNKEIHEEVMSQKLQIDTVACAHQVLVFGVGMDKCRLLWTQLDNCYGRTDADIQR